MPRKTAEKSSKPLARVTQLPTGRTLRVVEERVELRGDVSLTQEAMAGWREGQRRCRARGRHNWGPFTVYDHGSWFDVVEQCGHCRNRRSAPFIKTSWGLRKADKWKPDYRDGYLLPKGAQRLGDDMHDELTAMDILSRRIVEALDDDEAI